MKLEIKKNTDNPIENQVIELEKEYKIKFPKDYKDFLIYTNGGECSEEQEYVYTNTLLHNEEGYLEMNNFFSVDELCYDLNVIYKTKKEDVHPTEDDIFLHKIMRIADTCNDSNIGIKLSEDDFGSIYILDTSHGEKVRVANSFNDFINNFRLKDY